MRGHGTRFECLRLRRHDHIGWVFAGSSGFAAVAGPFLAEGAALGERLMYVAADPGPSAVAMLADVVGPDALQVASIAENLRAVRGGRRSQPARHVRRGPR